MKNTLFTLSGVAFALCYAPFAYAGEIHYGTLKAQHDDTLLIEYKSPAGPSYYTCSFSGTCKNRGTTTPELFPKVLNSRIYEKSADGTLAVRSFVLQSTIYYFLYDIRGTTAKKVAIIPYKQLGANVRIAKNNTAVVFQKGDTFTQYDIATKQLKTVTLPQELSFLQLSPNASYVTGYNYNTLTHEVWSFKTGKKLTGPSAMQSYLEFSTDESRIAFLDDVKGFRTLFTMLTSDLGKTNPPSLTQLTKPNTETEDYLFVDDTLYYMANVDGPLEWDLFAYTDKKTTLVDTDVSYGDYLQYRSDGKKAYLAYLKTTGKNSEVYLVTPHADKPTILDAVPSSPASTEVVREVKTYGDRTGVLLSPKKPARSPALFVWMHGGPQRQVAKGYHPYLSYAVYDEMLERLVEGGHYVYKIDYTGSSGYGAEFRKALSMKIGDIEMRDIEDAIDDIERDIKVRNVFLIGNSYGGYMALRGIVDTPKKLDGVVSINGVSNWYDLIQRIPSSPFKTLFNGVPDTHNLDAYLQASVYSGMENLSSLDKMLVVWGKNDSTVPVWQSKDYVTYAKTKNVNVDTLTFNDEDHIIRKRENLDALCSKVTSFLRVRSVACSL